jgi:hypothetical protein
MEIDRIGVDDIGKRVHFFKYQNRELINYYYAVLEEQELPFLATIKDRVELTDLSSPDTFLPLFFIQLLPYLLSLLPLVFYPNQNTLCIDHAST